MELRAEKVMLKSEKSIFLNKDFMLLFFGKLVSQLGDSIYNIAIAWFILATTGKASYMAIYLALGKATYIIVSPFAGVLADKWNRKRIIYGMDLIRGVVVAGLTLVVYLDMSMGVVISGLFITSFTINACGALFNPTSRAIIPLIINEKQLTKANSLSSMVQSICSLLGAVIGGVLYINLGVYLVIFINAASYILSGISEMFINIPQKDEVPVDNGTDEKPVSKSFASQLKEGYIFLKKERSLFVLTWFCFIINFLGAPVFAVFLPYIFNQIVKTDPTHLAYVQAALGVGVLLGSIFIGMLPQKDSIYKVLRNSLVLQIVPMLGIGVTLYLYQVEVISQMVLLYGFLISFGLIGVMTAMINIPAGVYTQRKVPNEVLGRVSALTSTLVMAAMPLGMILGGVLTDTMPMIVSLSIILGLYGITTKVFWSNKHMREI